MSWGWSTKDNVCYSSIFEIGFSIKFAQTGSRPHGAVFELVVSNDMPLASSVRSCSSNVSWTALAISEPVPLVSFGTARSCTAPLPETKSQDGKPLDLLLARQVLHQLADPVNDEATGPEFFLQRHPRPSPVPASVTLDGAAIDIELGDVVPSDRAASVRTKTARRSVTFVRSSTAVKSVEILPSPPGALLNRRTTVLSVIVVTFSCARIITGR